MAVSASSVLRRAGDILQDNGCVGWTVGELVRWLNDGQLEICVARPDARTVFGSVALAAGDTRQVLPAGATKLMDVVRNTANGKLAIRMIDREQLDEQLPGWHGATSAAVIRHAMFDARDPTTFWVHPPAAAGASVDALYGVLPTDIAEPASGDYSAVVGSISVRDIFKNALLDYVLYRAYSKDSDETGNGARAVAHFQAFKTALGDEVQATVAASPAKATSS